MAMPGGATWRVTVEETEWLDADPPPDAVVVTGATVKQPRVSTWTTSGSDPVSALGKPAATGTMRPALIQAEVVL